MIPHAVDEMHALGRRCPPAGHTRINGWWVDRWTLTPSDVKLVADLYRATLIPDIDAEIENEILDNGLTIGDLLIDTENSRDEITRSDATELAATASFLSADEWPSEHLIMPNVPKQSRRRSDSGFDAMTATMGGEPHQQQLSAGDILYIGSVKHTVQLNASGVRYELVNSISKEITATYLARQLTVLHGRMRLQGVSRSDAQRVFYFLRHIDDSSRVKVYGAMVIDPRASDALSGDLDRNLPDLSGANRWVRVVEIPDLPSLHDRCV